MDEDKYARREAHRAERTARREARQQMRANHTPGAGGLTFGAIIVVVGVMLLLDNMGIVRFHDIWRFWPLALVALGLSRIVECHRPAALVWGGTLAAVGALLFLDNLGIVVFRFQMIWPLLIIAFGIGMLMRSTGRSRWPFPGTPFTGAPLPAAAISGSAFPGVQNPDWNQAPPNPAAQSQAGQSQEWSQQHWGAQPGWDGMDADPTFSLFAIFGGSKRRIATHDFRGGEAFAFCGGLHIDLRGAQMPSGRAIVDINTMFGGCEIIVPDTWLVNVKAMGIFGGVDDKTVHPRPIEGTRSPELVLTGSALFGGIAVRN